MFNGAYKKFLSPNFDLLYNPNYNGKNIIYQQTITNAQIAPWGFVMGEGHSTMMKINIEKALQINKP